MQEESEVTFFDITGRKVKTLVVQAAKEFIQVDIPQGVYVVVVRTKSQTVLIRQKWTKM
jgi:hypothetical protein